MYSNSYTVYLQLYLWPHDCASVCFRDSPPYRKLAS